MKNTFEKLIAKTGAHTALTETEREKMRLLLREYSAMKPIREPAASTGTRAAFVDQWFSYLQRPVGITVATLLIIILSSGGVAYAAEGSLPGSVLYPVKINVLEPLQVAVAPSPEAKALLQMTFAEQRITEAATLARSGKLSTTTEAELAANFTKNAQGAAGATAQERMHNPTTADLLATGFAARLAAYESVLAVVNKHSLATDPLSRFQTEIQTQLTSIVQVAQATSSQDALVQDRSATTGQGVLRLQNAADAALNVSADIIGRTTQTLDASSSADARNELIRASALAQQGRALLEQHDTRGASRAFQDSLSATARLDVLTRAAATLNIQAFATTSEPSASSATTTENGTVLHLPTVQKDKNLPIGL